MRHSEIKQVGREVRRWRTQKSYPTEPMPQTLRSRVVRQCRKHPLGIVSSELGISRGHLTRLLQQAKPSVRKKRERRGRFVELRPAAIVSGPVGAQWAAEVEWRRADGSTLTTRVGDPSVLNWKTLIEALPTAGQ